MNKLLVILAMTVLMVNKASARVNPFRIVVLDSGRMLSYGFPECKGGKEGRDFTNTSLEDNFYKHGTNVAWIITKELGDIPHCFIFVKFLDPLMKRPARMSAYMDALRYINTNLDYDIVNMSFGGDGEMPGERQLINSLSKKKGVLIMSSGNNAINLDLNCIFYPACFRVKNSIVVGNIDPQSNYGRINVDVYEPGTLLGPPKIRMSGSSQATALFTGKLLKFIYKKKKRN